MRPPHALAVTVLLATTAGIEAQSPPAVVQTVEGVHEVGFQTPQGSVSLFVASDAAPGDTISGALVAVPAGRSPQEREKNLAELNGLVVEWQGRAVPVTNRRYSWVIPATLRTGRAALALRARNGRVVSYADVPIDGVPAPAIPRPSGIQGFDLPTDVQAGQPAVIRGPLDGTLTRKAVRFGEAEAELIASSPRRLAFRVPDNQIGEVPLRLISNEGVVGGTVRVITIRLTSTALQFAPGQKGTMTTVVGGLGRIAEPVTLTLRNFSPDVVRVQNGDVQNLTIAPRQVQPDGRVTLTHGLTGVAPGPLQVIVVVAPPVLSRFDVRRAADRALTVWEAATGIRIAAAARTLIQQSVLEAKGPLEQFLTEQQANRGDARDVFAALLSHYCFDLRDAKLRPGTAAMRSAPASFGITDIAFAQAPPRAPGLEIDAADVRRFSFREYFTQLISRFGSQPVGYLLISSMPASAGITIDGQRKSELTNRRFVTSIGQHAIVIAGASKTCQQRVQVAAFQISVVACN